MGDARSRSGLRRRSASAGAVFTVVCLIMGAGARSFAAHAGELGAAALATPPAPAMPAPGEIKQPVAEPDGYRMDDYRQPVPPTLKGARVISTEEAEKIWMDAGAVFIDVFPKPPKPANLPAGTVWRDPSHMSIKGGHWLPNVGHGVLTPEVEAYFRKHLEAFTGADRTKPIVFYCLKDCWMSWNAAKRALSWGYGNVIWFPEGTDGWTEAGNDIVYLTSEP